MRKYNGLQRVIFWVQGRETRVPVQAELQWKFVLNQGCWIFHKWVLTVSPSPPEVRKHRPENHSRKAYFANSCNNRYEFRLYPIHVSCPICTWWYYQHTALTVWRKTKPFSKQGFLKMSRSIAPRKYWLGPQYIEQRLSDSYRNFLGYELALYIEDPHLATTVRMLVRHTVMLLHAAKNLWTIKQKFSTRRTGKYRADIWATQSPDLIAFVLLASLEI
jgi:hypothetical protein